jgi:hypothetical protein
VLDFFIEQVLTGVVTLIHTDLVVIAAQQRAAEFDYIPGLRIGDLFFCQQCSMAATSSVASRASMTELLARF